MEVQRLPPIPKQCPFTIEECHIKDGIPSPRDKTFLIREHDKYGEYPHIYAKICQQAENLIQTVDGREKSAAHRVIVLSDTGCGTEVPCWHSTKRRFPPSHQAEPRSPYPRVWNIFTFLEYTLNPGSQIPYLVMTTHCHYDHILGIWKLPPTTAAGAKRTAAPATSRTSDNETQRPQPAPPATTVLTSSHGKAFVTPYANLQKHSLAGTLGLCAPKYDVGIWAEDYSQVVYHSNRSDPPSTTQPTPQSDSTHRTTIQIPTPYTILHTPGHTPDSLSWYDADNRVLCVGDSFYLKETSSTRGAPWGREPPMPTMFDKESDLVQWWRSLHKVLAFVVEKNRELRQEVSDRGRVQQSDGDGSPSSRPIPPTTTSRPWVPSLSLFSSRRRTATATQPGNERPPDSLNAPTSHSPQLSFRTLQSTHLPANDPWLLVDLDDSDAIDSHPRVDLAAAHTTCNTDAETAILEIKAFVAAILRDELPKRKVGNGPRGEERWLWDVDVNADDEELEKYVDGMAERRSLQAAREWRFSVLAPIEVVEDGRRRIPRIEWESD